MTQEGQFIKKIFFSFSFYQSGTPTLEKCGNPHILRKLSSMSMRACYLKWLVGVVCVDVALSYHQLLAIFCLPWLNFSRK
jgi:hypothetical protein